MAKILLVLLTLCTVPSITIAAAWVDPLLLKGFVYCDTCRCGFETSASKYLAGSVVRVECRSRKTSELTYTKEKVTHQWVITRSSFRGDDYCDAVLVKSSDPECSIPAEGLERARVILTKNNGMTSNARFANALGFFKDTSLPNCAQILKEYQ